MNMGGFAEFLPGMIRLIGFSVTGAAIGLFIGFIEEVTKKAWLKRLVGHNEGKEYTIFKQRTLLGRSEMADVAVFGDPDVAERHASDHRPGQSGSYRGSGLAFRDQCQRDENPEGYPARRRYHRDRQDPVPL